MNRPSATAAADDHALVEQARRGDDEAFEELMRRHQRLVFRVAWSFCRQRETAMDITQAVFLKAWRGLDAYRGEASFRTWLVRIAHREGLDSRRRVDPVDRASVTIDAVQASDDRDSGHPDLAPSLREPAAQESALLERETMGQVSRALSTIHRRYRSAIELRYLHRLSIREISAILRTSDTMTKNLLFRGVRSLRRAVEKAAGTR